ncbi:MAG: hypothetical protein BGO01_21305 [Armatimonadetes bacterium 55-13]|nr:carotenoid biosynthesis protein [Armatimonadota bacterium]OJU64645.1 MAG: hypothetical protein BGO01_21305 [Armatimonadetes bacterium 55-13]
MRHLSIWCRIYVGLVAFSILGSGLTALTGLDPGPIKPAAALLTLLFGTLAVFAPFEKRGVLLCGAVVAIGAMSEVCGIYTGWPFGRYAYSSVWWPTFTLPGGHFFPALLPFAWALVVGGAYAHGKGVWMAAILATLMDFVMEPVMTGRLRYWNWLEAGPLPGGAPVLNSIGWFVVSLLAAAAMSGLGASKRIHRDAVVVFYGHLILTLAIGAIGQTVSKVAQ